MSPEDEKQWLKTLGNILPLLPKNIKVEDVLDEGGQGVVYKGLVAGKAAAIKVYFPGQHQIRIEREVQALQKLSCSSIVNLLWEGVISFRNQDLPVVATELIDGDSLNKVLEKRSLDSDELGMLAYDIAGAIDAMWEQRIVHRDLKPANVLIKPNGRACVIDLGVARYLEESSLTAMGMTWGTLGYMSPEQTKCVRQLTCKSDLFALGIILVESSLQRHPTNRDQLRLMGMKLHENLPIEINNWSYANIVRNLLDPKPIKRPLPSQILASLTVFKNNLNG
jgi:eukaryotic-like serine/threonine-protein kinase